MELEETQTDINEEYEELLLAYYPDPEKFERLLQAGADSNVEDGGINILFYFAAFNEPEAVQTLLEYGAHPDATNQYGMTALHVAAFSDFREIVIMLLEAGADPDLQDVNGGSALMLHMLGTELGDVLEEAGAVVQ